MFVPKNESWESLRGKIALEIMETYRSHVSWYPSKPALERILDAWREKKSALIEKMRNHPGWNEDALAVVVEVQEERKTDTVEAIKGLNKLVLNGKLTPMNNLKLWSDFIRSKIYNTSMLTSDAAKAVNDMFEKHGIKLRLSQGQRTSRAIRRILLEFGFNEKDRESNQYFNEYTGLMSESSVPVQFVFSVHPLDFILMSNGNSWNSCHYFGGCFSSGVYSLMGDDVSVITYTVKPEKDMSSAEKERSLWWHKKRMRQLFVVNEKSVLASRLYPGTNDGQMRSRNWDTVLNIHAKMYAKKINWRRVEPRNASISNACNSTHYPDWEHGYNAAVYQDPDVRVESLVVGSQPRCVVCGNTNPRTGHHVCGDGCYRTLVGR